MPYIWIMYLLLLVFLLHTYRTAYGTRIYYFYKPECKFCKELKPAWRLFSDTCSWTMTVPVEIDISQSCNDKLKKNFNFKTVPHIVKVKNDTREIYDGERTSENILEWSKK